MDDSTKLLNDLVGQLGKSMGIDALSLDEDGFCTIGFDEVSSVTIHSNAEQGSVVLSAEVGAIAPEYELDAYRAMLQANYAWGLTDGIGTLSIEPDGEDGTPSSGVASLMHQTPLVALDAASFQALFDRFLAVAEAWSEFLSEAQAADESPAEAAPIGADPNLRRV